MKYSNLLISFLVFREETSGVVPYAKKINTQIKTK
jgi:hypothetical protein